MSPNIAQKKGTEVYSVPFLHKKLHSDEFYAAADECSQSLTLKHSVLEQGQVDQLMDYLIAGGILRIDV